MKTCPTCKQTIKGEPEAKTYGIPTVTILKDRFVDYWREPTQEYIQQKIEEDNARRSVKHELKLSM